MSQPTEDLKSGYMPNGDLYAANRRRVRDFRANNLEHRKEQERAAWHRRKERVKAKKLAARAVAVSNTIKALS